MYARVTEQTAGRSELTLLDRLPSSCCNISTNFAYVLPQDSQINLGQNRLSKKRIFFPGSPGARKQCQQME